MNVREVEVMCGYVLSRAIICILKANFNFLSIAIYRKAEHYDNRYCRNFIAERFTNIVVSLAAS